MSKATKTRARKTSQPCPKTRTNRETQRTGVPMDATNPGTFIRDSIIFMRDLKDSPFRLYCMVRSHVWENDKVRTVAITSAELEHMMGRSRSTIWRYLENLRDVGLIGLHEQRIWWVYQGTASGHAERRTMNVYSVFDLPLDDYDGPRSVSDVRKVFEGKYGPRLGDRVHVRSAKGDRIIEHFNPHGPNDTVSVEDAEDVDEASAFPGFNDPIPAPRCDEDAMSVDQSSTDAEPQTAQPAEEDVSAGQSRVSKMNEDRVKNDTPYKNASQYSGGTEGSAGARAIEGERVVSVSAASWDAVAKLARAVLPRGEALSHDEYRGLAIMCEHARGVVESGGRMTWDEYWEWAAQGWVAADGRPRYKSFIGTLAWRFKEEQINSKAWAWVCQRRGEREAAETRGTREEPLPNLPMCHRHVDTLLGIDGRCPVCEDECLGSDMRLPDGWGIGPEPDAHEVQQSFELAGVGVGATTSMEAPEAPCDAPGGGTLVRGRVKGAQAAWGALRSVKGEVSDEPEWRPIADR